MESAEKPAKRVYVVLLFENVNEDYYGFQQSQREQLIKGMIIF